MHCMPSNLAPNGFMFHRVLILDGHKQSKTSQLWYCYLMVLSTFCINLHHLSLCSCRFIVMIHIWGEINAACYNQFSISLYFIPPGRLLTTTEYTSQWMRCLSNTHAYDWYWESYPIHDHNWIPKCSWSKNKCILKLWSILHPQSMETTVYNVFISPIMCTWMS